MDENETEKGWDDLTIDDVADIEIGLPGEPGFEPLWFPELGPNEDRY